MAIWGGKYGYITIGSAPAVRLKMAEWTLAFDGDDPDTTNFESGGCSENVEGIHDATITINGPYDTGGVLLVRGAVYFFTLGVGTGFEFTVSARVKTITPSQKIRGKSEIQITAKTTSPFVPLVA